MDDATTADLADKFMGEDIDRILQVTRSSRPLSGPLSRPLSRPRPHLLFVDRMVQERSKEVEFTDGGGYDEEENGEDDTAAAAAAAAAAGTGASSSSSGAGGEVKRGRGRPRKSQFAQVPSLRTLPRLSPSPDPDPLPRLSPSLCPSLPLAGDVRDAVRDPAVRPLRAPRRRGLLGKGGLLALRPRAHALLSVVSPPLPADSTRALSTTPHHPVVAPPPLSLPSLSARPTWCEQALPKSNTRVGRLKALFEDDEQVRSYLGPI